jgi:hypothetical protein
VVRIETHSDDIETGVVSRPREEHGGNLPTGHVVSGGIGGATLIWALVRELENLFGDGKGKGTSGGTARPKVPMRQSRGGLLRSSGETG